MNVSREHVKAQLVVQWRLHARKCSDDIQMHPLCQRHGSTYSRCRGTGTLRHICSHCAVYVPYVKICIIGDNCPVNMQL